MPQILRHWMYAVASTGLKIVLGMHIANVYDCAYTVCGRAQDQGRSQPHSPGWARVPISSFFPQISIIFSYFSSNCTNFFLISAFRVGESPTREGPGYAAAQDAVCVHALSEKSCHFLILSFFTLHINIHWGKLVGV